MASARKKGYLHKFPLKGVVKKWSRRWFVLYPTTHEGVLRMEYFDAEEHEGSGLGKRTIPLRGARSIAQSAATKGHPFVFELESQMGHHMFAADSQRDLDEWLSAIKEAVKEDSQRKRRKSSQRSISSLAQSEYSIGGSSVSSIPWDSTNSGVYRVTLEFNETAERMNLQGNYNLEVSPEAVVLVAANSGAQIAIWPYRHIKSYGKSAGRITIETGRSAESGEGKFVCVSTCCREIFGIINRNIRRLRDEKEKDRLVKEAQDVEQAITGVKKSKEKWRPSIEVGEKVTTQSRPRPRPSKPTPYPPPSTNQRVPSGTAGTYRRSIIMEDTTDGFLAEVDPQGSPSTSHKRYSGGHNLQKSSHAPAPQHEKAPNHLPSVQSRAGQGAFTSATRGETSPPSHVSTSATSAHANTEEVDFTSTDNLLANLEASIAAMGRTSYSSRDSRDSAMGRTSYSSRDSRDSAIVGQLPEGSFDNPLACDDFTTLGVANPLGEMSEQELDFQITDIDDELLDTVDEMEQQDNAGEVPPPSHMPPSMAPRPTKPYSSTARPHSHTERRMSQQELDVIWNEISCNLPDSSAFS